MRLFISASQMVRGDSARINDPSKDKGYRSAGARIQSRSLTPETITPVYTISLILTSCFVLFPRRQLLVLHQTSYLKEVQTVREETVAERKRRIQTTRPRSLYSPKDSLLEAQNLHRTSEGHGMAYNYDSLCVCKLISLEKRDL